MSIKCSWFLSELYIIIIISTHLNARENMKSNFYSNATEIHIFTHVFFALDPHGCIISEIYSPSESAGKEAKSVQCSSD